MVTVLVVSDFSRRFFYLFWKTGCIRSRDDDVITAVPGDLDNAANKMLFKPGTKVIS